MSKLRTTTELQQYFQQLKEKRERKKERQERLKQKQLDNAKAEEKKQNLRLEKHLYEQQRTIIIYHTRYVGKFINEEETYNKYELQNIDTLYPNEFGRINWNFYNRLVKNTIKQINRIL